MLGFCVAVLAAIGFDAIIRRATGHTGSDVATPCLGRSGGRPHGSARGGQARTSCARARQYAFGRGQRRLVRPRDAGRAGDLRRRRAGRRAGRVARDEGWLRVAALAIVPVLVVGPALALVLPFWPRVPTEQFYPSTPTHTFLTEHAGSDRIDTAATMQAGTEGYYGVRTVGGRSFVAEEYDRLLRAWCNGCFLTPTYMTAAGGSGRPGTPAARPARRALPGRRPAADDRGESGADGSVEASDVRLEPGNRSRLTLPDGSVRAVGIDVAEP